MMVSPKKEGVFLRESPVTAQISSFDDLTHKKLIVLWRQDVVGFLSPEFRHSAPKRRNTV